MSRPLEDYALIGDTETAALVSRDGAIDWLCFPRFDSGACFAALLGDEDNGTWRIAPRADDVSVRRRYRPGTLVLETEFETPDGTVRLVDGMPPRGTQSGDQPDVVRLVEGVSGRVPMAMDLVVRFDYGRVVPWVTAIDHQLAAVAGPDGLRLSTPVELHGVENRTVAEFEVAEGDRVPFVLTWHPSYEPAPEPVDAAASLDATTDWWREWSSRSTYDGPWQEAVNRSLITLKALTFAPSGGIVAAPTTSLPEELGGVRNWDYRYVWIRDATMTLTALILGGYRDEAIAWRDWLLRAVAGDPSKLQIMYGVAGERRLPEFELPWLDGYEGSSPVRIGNGAVDQTQFDIFGEVMDAMHYARLAGMEPDRQAWDIQTVFLEFLESSWTEPDHGIWEVRGRPRDFTYSKVMAWVAFDRAVTGCERYDLPGPVDRWRRIRQDIREEVESKGYDVDANTFTMSFGSRDLDAALLLIPQVGFLPPDDERVRGTVEAVERELATGDILVHRYLADEDLDGLPGSEGAFLLCSYWLADALAMIGRHDEARDRFEQLLALRNDVGLLAEEIDPTTGRMVGNFPQAFSHIGLVNTACNLTEEHGPAEVRSRSDG